MHSLLSAFLAMTLVLLSGCSCQNPFSNFNCGIPNIFGDDSCDSNERYDVPQAPNVDLPPPVLSVHAEEITAIVQEYSVELRNLKRLHLRHANTYYNESGIHTIQLQYISQDIVELCQARKLIIDIAEGFLGQLNSNCLLVPEFSYGGFFPFNLEIYIHFESYFVKYVDPFYVKWIVMEDGAITFYTADADDNEKKGWHARKESYDTSRNIVLYERLAEDNWKAMHETNKAIFGEKRFWQTNKPPPKHLE